MSQAGDESGRRRGRLGLYRSPMWALGLCFAAVLTHSAQAHERWILTPEQILEWNAKPMPGLYSELSWLNFSMIAGFLLFTVGWIRLGFTGARELFPDLQARLGSYGDLVAPILRFCLAWALISSTFGLEPRHGVAPFSSPTLFAPDLELSLLGPSWAWLRWVQLLLGLGFLFGVYVRILAGVLILLALLAAVLFGAPILAYAGALLGVAIYLVMQGPGSYYVPMPTEPRLRPLQAWLEAQPRSRAQAIMRVLTGITIFYLGFYFKVLQPNLAIGIITLYDVPLMSSAPETFTLLMTLVEVTAGILIVAGILLRPLSLFFLFAFLTFALLLPESLMAHVLFYGVMLSFLFNSAGYWHMPEATDKAANIVIVGGTVAAIHAAMKIEKLVGQFTNVKLTLIHDQPNMLFHPLLPEVIGGTMQPGNAVNPIRRVLPQTRVILGELLHIDSEGKRVDIRRSDDKPMTLPYDELILASFPQPNFIGISGLMAHSSPINSVGDALHIRKRVMDLIERAEFEENPAERQRLLAFAVIGSGQRPYATAVEISEMLNTAKASYPVLREHGWQVHLFEGTQPPFSSFEEEIRPRCDRELQAAGVLVHRESEVTAVTATELVLANGTRQPVGLVVNGRFDYASVPIDEQSYRAPLAVTPELKFVEREHIWATTLTAQAGERPFLTTSDWVSLGRTAGQNAWASSQGYATQPFRARKRWLKPYNMGRHSVCQLGPWLIGGGTAWVISRVTNLMALPGLERNLRILVDWFLDIPFRADIAVLAPDATERLQRCHYEAGDEIIRQGDTGDTAYVIEAGRVEVVADGRKVTEYGPGDFFGELALVSDSLRTATVRCLTPCELTVLSRDDFHTLTVGSGTLANAIRKQIDERLQAIRV